MRSLAGLDPKGKVRLAINKAREEHPQGLGPDDKPYRIRPYKKA